MGTILIPSLVPLEVLTGTLAFQTLDLLMVWSTSSGVTPWVQLQSSSCRNCVILSKSLKFCMAPFPHPWNLVNNSTSFVGFL